MPLEPGLMPLVGSWCLISIRYMFSDRPEHIDPFGPAPEGRMVLEPNGRIMFLFTRSNRQPPENDIDRAALFNGLGAYTGLVRPDGPGRFITAVDVAWHPAYGGEQLRLFTIEDDRLTIRTLEMTVPQFPGRPHVAEVIFKREQQ